MKCGLTVTEISEDRQSCKEQQSDDFESHVLWDVESSLLFYIRCTWPIPILYLQDSAKSGIGSYPYKLPPLNPSTTSSSTIPNTRGYEESRGPPTQSHKTAQSPQSMGPPSQNPHIHHSTYSYPNSRPSAQTQVEPRGTTSQRGHDSALSSLNKRAPRPPTSSSPRANGERPAPSPANHTSVPYSHPQFQPHPGLVHSSPPASNQSQATVPQHNPHKPWRNQVTHTEFCIKQNLSVAQTDLPA